MYISGMGENDRTIWDDAKNATNIKARKIDFSDLDRVFDGRFSIVAEDKRHDYGEQRFNMLVEFNKVILNITFTHRPPAQAPDHLGSITNRKERRVYHAEQQSR